MAPEVIGNEVLVLLVYEIASLASGYRLFVVVSK